MPKDRQGHIFVPALGRKIKDKRIRRVNPDVTKSQLIQSQYGLKFPEPGFVWKLGSVESDELSRKQDKALRQPERAFVLEPYQAPLYNQKLAERVRKANLENWNAKHEPTNQD